MEAKQISPLKAIRLKCLDCSGGSKIGVKQCNEADCPLHPFRLGKNPNRAGITNNGSFKAKNNGSTGDFTENCSGV